MDKDKSLLKILKDMFSSRWINHGIPVVAAVFDDDLEIVFIESNKKVPKGEYGKQIYKKHAEWLCMDKIQEFYPKEWIKEGLNFNIMITTTPCDYCSKRIKKFNFKNIYFLIDKFDSEKDLNWETIEPKPIKYIPKSRQEKKIIKIMDDMLQEINIKNKEKTNLRKEIK